ncbi:MAG: molybdopterin-guanine dinucleotide biosynthesis protein B [Methanobrevibacter sp.]|uniref:molybdopterin-guanine dinucleotide biosynthesis protein B n=1 Tax=Methanobrevibacter sp. TaxID=66852 RepID=UPI001B02B863|nr:molybdopterin-guanine dinucleotide biosynthesis protein B [Methanobrevibacter sp.]MBO5151582.1 molybdopterin-guanine dinucleotide biosynthesis protein B [Methanobrevibacter sp.]
MKIVSIVGRKNTGKTSLSVKVIDELTKRGYNVASVKHSHHSIEMDKENTDTWKHKQAGANLVVGVGSTTFFNSRKEHDLNRILYLLKHFDNFDFVIVEGYKTYNYPKIATSSDVVDKYTIKQVDSFTITEKGVSDLVDLIEEKGHDIIDTLFKKNCGYNDGESIAQEIREGNIKTEELDDVTSYLSIDGKVIGLNRFVSDYFKQVNLGIINTLNIKDYGVEDVEKIELLIHNENKLNGDKSNSKISINQKPLEINQFVKDIISNSIKGMVNSLKTQDDIEKICVEIKGIENNELYNADILLKVNDEELNINKFTCGILKESIFAMVTSLKIDEEINEIKIDVEV